MFAIWVLTAILASCNVPIAMTLWAWFGAHIWQTILLLIFLA